MMKLDGRFCRLMCMVLCAVLLAGLLPAGMVDAAAEEKVYGRIIKKNVFFRYNPSASSDYKFRMALNTIVEITKDKGDTSWYGIAASEPGQDYTSDGYCAADCLEIMTAEDVENWLQVGAPAVYAKQEAAGPTPEPVPEVLGYVTIIPQWHNDGVNLRDGVDGNAKLVWKLSYAKALPYIATESGWYKVIYDETAYYVNGTVVSECNADGDPLTSDTPESVPEPDTAPTGYVTIREGYNSVNLRQSAGGTYRGMWKLSEFKVLPYEGQPTPKDGYNWYPVNYKNNVYYATGKFVVECDKDGNIINTPSPAPDSGSTATPAPDLSGTGTLILTTDKVIFRTSPGGSMIRRLSKGTVMPYDSYKTYDGYTWFHAEASDGKKGYIREDVCDVINGTWTEDGIIVGYLELIKDKVNLRKKPAGTSMQQLALGLVLPVLDDIDGQDGGTYDWFRVKAPDGSIGYVRSDCIKITDGGSGSDSSVATPKPSSGYVMITDNQVKLRSGPAGGFVKFLNKNEVYPLTGTSVDKSGYTWYPIKAGSSSGYVRHDFSMVLSQEQIDAYLNGNPIPSPTPTPTGNLPSSFLVINENSVNLRASASTDSEQKFQVNKGTVLGYNLKQTVGGVEWYKGVYKNTNIWVKAEFADVMTNDEYQAWLAAHPDAEKPTTEVISGYVKLIETGVNLRQTAGGTVITRLNKGLVMPYAGTEFEGGNLWYYVKSPSGYGFVMDDMLVLTDENGVELPDATPDMTVGGSTGDKPEATYETLRKGASGNDVKKMVTELKKKGYFTGTVTSNYNDAVVEAVKKFQKAEGLNDDGIAGPLTLHALYGTVPVGSSGSMPEMKIYPVEKIDWWKGGIQKLWPKGKNVVVMDVKTGTTFWAHRWSGGNHVDAEPLTAADTARICKMYGVQTADQIESKNLWHRRPLWITIGERTFCASMFGFPHNYPDGDTIPDNDFKGQFCIHFTNSAIHRTDLICEYHQEAIDYAYKKAPSRK